MSLTPEAPDRRGWRSWICMVGGLTLTMQGFGQHEPLVRPILHAGSFGISHLSVRNIVFTSEQAPMFAAKSGFPGWKGE